MSSKLSFALLALSIVALVAVTQTPRGAIEPAAAQGAAEATQLSTEPSQLQTFERNVHELSLDERRIEQSRMGAGSEGPAAVGICSITCRRCTSNAGCPPFMGETQTCVFDRLCP